MLEAPASRLTCYRLVPLFFLAYDDHPVQGRNAHAIDAVSAPKAGCMIWSDATCCCDQPAGPASARYQYEVAGLRVEEMSATSYQVQCMVTRP
jgi:hypothetical protein